MKRIYSIIALLLAFAILSPGASFAATNPKWGRGGTLATATVGGSFYLWGVGFANMMKEKMPEYQIALEVTGGATHNLQLQEAAETDFAQAYASGMYDALHGLAWAKGKKHTRIRAILPASLNLWVAWAPEKTGIKKLKDLNGKVIHLNSKGSTPDTYTRYWFDALGVKPGKLVNSNLSEQVAQMSDGLIDAAFGVGNDPYGPPMELEAQMPINILVFEPDDIAKIRALQPYWAEGTRKAGVYKTPTAKEPMNTLVVWVYMICRDDTPEDLVYAITKTYFENLDIMDQAYKGTSLMRPEDILNTTMPIHKGSARYYKEIGINIPPELVVD